MLHLTRLVPLLFFIVLPIIGVNLHCQPASDNARQNESKTAGSELAPVLGTLPEFSLVDQNGATYGSSQLRGKMWIATFIFTRSQSTTPHQVAQLAALQQHLETQPVWSGIRLVSISAEPEHDTPAILQDFAGQLGADATHWKFLTGSRDEIWRLCNQGFELPVREGTQTEQRPITHSTKFVLIDRNLRIRGYYDAQSTEGLNELIAGLDHVVPELSLADIPDDKLEMAQIHLVIPPENNDIEWIEQLRQNQLEKAQTFNVRHDFEFTDRRAESAISFRNKIVNNAGKDWMPNHYDHGNGVTIADINGDGLHDIYFTTQVGSNELWQNLGEGVFKDVTLSAGDVGIEDKISVTASFADIDNDGDADLYVTTVRGGNFLFENDGAGVFSDISAASGTAYNGHSSGAMFFDYNRDGLLDLFLTNVGIYTNDNLLPVTNGTSPEQERGRFKFYEGYEDAFIAHLYPDRAERSILYKNTGDNRFVDVSEEVGLIDNSWSGDASSLDANQDGWPDLYILNMQGHDEYYENVKGERFVKKSRETFPRTPWGSMGIKVFDHDNNGTQDIYITDMHSDMSENVGLEREKLKARMQWPDSLLQSNGLSIFGNAFYNNSKNEIYSEISDAIGAENYWPWGISTGDLNADGYEDAFLSSSMNFPFRYGVNSLLLNNLGNGFLDSEFILGVEPRDKKRTFTPWFSLDCTEGVDLAHEYCQNRKGRVVVWGALGTRSSVIFDLDNDGDLDIVTNDFNSAPQVLISDLSNATSRALQYIKVKLIGTTSNRDGLGAIVKVHAGNKAYVKVFDGKSGYLSQSTYPLYFGLDTAQVVDVIEVQWPSGIKQLVQGPIEINRVVEITEE